MTTLADLFPAGDYRFHLTLRRGAPRDFFGAQDPSGRILAERARWIAENPARHVALLPAGEALLAEVADIAAAEWGYGRFSTAAELGERLEPDMLLLSPDATGAFRLQGGALCFPTGWALEDKLGQSMDFIHGAVPGLNAALASPIHQFLSRLKPGVAFFRDNWGVVASDELNLHPARQIAAPSLPLDLEHLWLRVEHQALLALPHTKGVLFGIRIALHRLDEVVRDPTVAAGFRHALATMPPEMAVYKRLDGIREKLIECVSNRAGF
ncbi:MAG: hypothetical protein JWM32_2328 [Verrucomicrobia bacterium]|nr:hypothetical protein [Verrucomicrobiota bacterium]